MEKISLKEQELVLNVKKNIDSNIWDETKYYKFIETLVNDRYYQEEAILTALRFMCSGQYKNIKDLATENYNENYHLQEKYSTLSSYINKLYFQDKYTANIDLATATGKSWVLYGIARIMLDTKFVDQVLVLVPSITIERELTEKFKFFAEDNKLNTTLNSIPPRIINGTESITINSICIENRDAIYNNARSSIVDSLKNKGNRTLILSDESHHIYYSDKNKWQDFINKIQFKYILGMSGTCYYKDDDYFRDVIYRYSLKQAIEEQRVKTVEYISEDNVPNQKEERWQVIINSHNEIKNKLTNANILPITIVVTNETSTCDARAEEFKKYLKKHLNIDNDEVNKRVLVVHSKPHVAGDRLRLKDVDKPNSKVEWIFSVSMLTEGWDVKRVFQIVPDEQRAFNSKLLIAQVLGRGLRVPDNWNNSLYGQPKVIIFNHAKWASGVKQLVNEVLEIEKRISTKVIPDSKYHMELLNLNYKRKATSRAIKTKKTGTYNLFEKGYVILPTDTEKSNVDIEYTSIDNKTRNWQTNINHNTISLKNLAIKMWCRFEDLEDKDLTQKYQEKYPIEKLEEIIKLSLEKSGNEVITDKIANRLLAAIGIAWRTGNAYLSYNTTPTKCEMISTKENLRSESTSASSLKSNHTLFWTDNTINNLTEEEKIFLNEIQDSGNGYKQIKIDNQNELKTVTSLVIATSEPEKKFISKLISKENSQLIDSWIKSTSTGFYSIEYAWKKNPTRHGDVVRYDKFNPDFFIKVKDSIIVVEIKDDSEIEKPSPENIGKYNFAKEHFEYINKHLKSKCKNHQGIKETNYKFTMLTPKNYDAFFESIKNNQFNKFNSELDVAISIIDKK